ncbi:MAG: hypothetical protein M1824_001209 [Vezdaea acicularis]|nr:MAG: hypothetical protein M1824_001209 [Vezdaea acicularis]
MPHAHIMPPSGFQALILCGPGASLNTFTSTPDDFPKALIPIANRPMIWYPLDWCYRMGVSAIHLVSPPSSREAINAALSINPFLTELPSPKASIVAPENISFNTGTAELLRQPEIQAVITGDFVILPCDLVCDLPGGSLLESWMILQSSLGGTARPSEAIEPQLSLNGELGGRRGGLGVWYQTKGTDSVKGEETDFIATTPLSRLPVSPSKGSLLPRIANLVYSLPTDTLNDIVEDKKSFPIRHALLRKHGYVKILSSYRDAHVYLFPFWTLDYILRNERFDSISEDVVGWWAKAGWQNGLGQKLGISKILEATQEPKQADQPLQTQEHTEESQGSETIEDEIDLASMSSTQTSRHRHTKPTGSQGGTGFASRVHLSDQDEGTSSISPIKTPIGIPPMLAYVHPTSAGSAMIRRVDTVPLLLAVSLRLAKLPSHEENGTSPLAHASKIAFSDGLAQRCTVTRADCLLADNVIVEEKAVIKESVIGVGCRIGAGARLTRCVLMDGVVVQEGYVVIDGTEIKNEKFMAFEGLDEQDAGSEGLEFDHDANTAA